MSMTTGFWNFCRNSVAILAANTTASGSSPLAWKIGASIILATSEGEGGEGVGGGAGGARMCRDPDWVVEHEVHRAAGAMAAQPGQAEAFGDHALAREGSVARDQQRHDHAAVVRRRAVLVLLGAHLAEHDRVDDLKMRRVGGQREMDP